MTRKLTISVPDDVAVVLDRQANVSAYITEAVRRRTDRIVHDETMRGVGLDPQTLSTPDAKRRARSRMYRTLEATARGRDLARQLRDGEAVNL